MSEDNSGNRKFESNITICKFCKSVITVPSEMIGSTERVGKAVKQYYSIIANMDIILNAMTANGQSLNPIQTALSMFIQINDIFRRQIINKALNKLSLGYPTV